MARSENSEAKKPPRVRIPPLRCHGVPLLQHSGSIFRQERGRKSTAKQQPIVFVDTAKLLHACFSSLSRKKPVPNAVDTNSKNINSRLVTPATEEHSHIKLIIMREYSCVKDKIHY